MPAEGFTSGAVVDAPEPGVEIYARPKSRITDEQAQAIHRVASQIEEPARKAPALVDLARDPESEIHDLFPWDDRVAAERHREEVARTLLRSVRVRIIHETGVVERPAFFSVKIEEDKTRHMAYVRYNTLSKDELLREQVVRRAKRDLDAFRSRNREYRYIFVHAAPELVELLDLADEILDEEEE